MPTTKDRLQVTLPKDIAKAIKAIAKRDGMPMATKAMYLMKAALELDEDAILDSLAMSRESDKKSKYLSHDEVWK